MSISKEELSELIYNKIDERMESEEVSAALKKASDLAKQASKLLKEATSELDVLGIGMYFSISPVGQSYVSNGNFKKSMIKDILELHTDLTEEDVCDQVSDTLRNWDGFRSEYGATGWQHSAVC
jgi:hypothetical protein